MPGQITPSLISTPLWWSPKGPPGEATMQLLSNDCNWWNRKQWLVHHERCAVDGLHTIYGRVQWHSISPCSISSSLLSHYLWYSEQLLWSTFLKNPHNIHPIAIPRETYGVSFVSTNSHLSNVWVISVPYEKLCFIWLNHNNNQLEFPRPRQYWCHYYHYTKWRHFPCYWPFVSGIHWSSVDSLTKASHADLWYFLWSAVEQTIGTPVIWDTIILITISL